MKIAYSPYSLSSCSFLNSCSINCEREGALLKIQFDDGIIGYADCHPWVELGDVPLNDQLQLLRHFIYTPLTYCSIQFARLDAEARAKRQALFERDDQLLSHLLITDLLKWTRKDLEALTHQGFTHIKLKMGRHLEEETKHLNQVLIDLPLKIRIDFNEKLSDVEFEQFLLNSQNIFSSLDFIEDPFPFQAQAWKEVQKEFPVKLACDRQVFSAIKQPDSAAFLIVKPAIQAKESMDYFPKEKVIITSYLDHPIGQLAAAYRIKELNLNDGRQHGILSHHAYQVNSFSRQLSWKGPNFLFPIGTGFGYDKELQALKWLPV